MDHEPLGKRSFAPFAARFAAAAPTKPHNAYYDRPAMLALLPEVRGKRVLDAGCGPGVYAEELLARGAEVVAVDVTPEFVTITKGRLGDRAVVIEANLEEPLAFAADGEFDVVLSALVLDHIEDWRPVMREFARVLRAGGTLLFSCSHPWQEFRLVAERGLSSGDYFRRELYSLKWGGFGMPEPTVTAWRRPLGEVLQPVLEAGLAIEAVVEPRPTEEFRVADPEEYETLMREPGFLCVRALKPHPQRS